MASFRVASPFQFSTNDETLRKWETNKNKSGTEHPWYFNREERRLVGDMHDVTSEGRETQKANSPRTFLPRRVRDCCSDCAWMHYKATGSVCR
mgnify:FL=1